MSRAGVLSARRYVGSNIAVIHKLYMEITCPCIAHAGSLVTGQSYQDNVRVDILEVNCTGHEATLSNCSVIDASSNCGSYVGAGVSCYSSKSCVKYIHA